MSIAADRIDELCVAEAARLLSERGVVVDPILFARRARALRQPDRGVLVVLREVER